MKSRNDFAPDVDDSYYHEYLWVNPSSVEVPDFKGRGVFIIDDEIPRFSLADCEGHVGREDGSVRAAQQGLLPIFHVVKTWPDTTFIAFLRLTDDEDIINSISDRVLSLVSSHENYLSQVYVLIDQFVGALDSGQSIGLRLRGRLRAIQKGLTAPKLIAAMKIAVLSIDAPMVDGFHKSQVQRYFDIHAVAGIETALPFTLLEWFGVPIDPDDVTDLDVRRWRVMRRAAMEITQRWYGFHHWQHHWRGGGGDCIQGAPREQQKRDFIQSIATTTGRPAPREWSFWPRWPDYSACEERDWRKPPIRALTQNVPGLNNPTNLPGRDLTQCFALGAAFVGRAYERATSLRSAEGAEFTHKSRMSHIAHDYLWFNAPCIVEGLRGLASQFVDEVCKFWDPLRSSAFDNFEAVTTAELEWSMEEVTNPNGFQIEIGQYVTGVRAGERRRLPHPLPSSPCGAAMSARYGYFARAGAQIKSLDDRLCLFIPADTIHDGIWLVHQEDQCES